MNFNFPLPHTQWIPSCPWLTTGEKLFLEQHYLTLYYSAISQDSDDFDPTAISQDSDDFDPTDYNGPSKPDDEPCDACAEQPNKKLKTEPCDASAKEAKPPDLNESSL